MDKTTFISFLTVCFSSFLLSKQTLEVQQYKEPFLHCWSIMKEPLTIKHLAKHSMQRFFCVFFVLFFFFPPEWGKAASLTLSHSHLCLSVKLKAHFVHHNKVTGKDKRVGGRQKKEGGRRSHITSAFIDMTFLQNKGENHRISPETFISIAVRQRQQKPRVQTSQCCEWRPSKRTRSASVFYAKVHIFLWCLAEIVQASHLNSELLRDDQSTLNFWGRSGFISWSTLAFSFFQFFFFFCGVLFFLWMFFFFPSRTLPPPSCMSLCSSYVMWQDPETKRRSQACLLCPKSADNDTKERRRSKIGSRKHIVPIMMGNFEAAVEIGS